MFWDEYSLSVLVKGFDRLAGLVGLESKSLISAAFPDR